MQSTRPTTPSLTFSRGRTPSPPPHAPIQRLFIPSPNGTLELLYARPEDPSKTPASTPIFFVHGGFGCASVWTEYMNYLSNAPYNIPCYAISLRGHGASWCPSYLRMVYGTTKRTLAEDIVTGVRYVQDVEEERQLGNEKRNSLEPVRVMLVAHSNGGGLAQLALSDGRIQVKGLALLESAPNSGVLQVYTNWLRLDPWFSLRVFRHLGHPRSPLSSTNLVHRAFFSAKMPECLVRRFESIMSSFESLLWPIGLMWRYVSIPRILQQVLGSDRRPGILVMAAGESKLMGVGMMQRMAAEYQQGVQERLHCRKGGTLGEDVMLSPRTRSVNLDERRDSGVSGTGSPVRHRRSFSLTKAIETNDRVWFHIVKGAGHQLQNDVQWEDGAAKLAEFYEACCAEVLRLT